jgi:hypothetical protein
MSDRTTPWETDRERRVFENMHRWRRVAEIEHARHCTAHHDCGAAVERLYNELREADHG